jgi:hypothetical protein
MMCERNKTWFESDSPARTGAFRVITGTPSQIIANKTRNGGHTGYYLPGYPQLMLVLSAGDTARD